MKQLIIFSILFICSITFAQEEKEKFNIEKGTISLEGSFNINSNKNTGYGDNVYDADYFSIGFYPNLGYAINDNLIIGLGVGYRYAKSETDYQQVLNDFSQTTNSYSVFPYIKKYFPIGEKFAFHVKGETMYTHNKAKINDNDAEITSNAFSIGIKPGINFSLSKKVFLQANFGFLGYNNNKNTIDEEDSSKNESFSLNLSSSNLTLGMAILL